MSNTDLSLLDKIIKKTIADIEGSKVQIFDIYESARKEMDSLTRDVENVKQQAIDIIFKVDDLSKKERNARIRLMDVSRNFQRYTEEDIRKAYEEANQLQIDLAVTRAHEQALRRRRDELEIRLKNLKQTVAKAEQLASQIGAVLGFLSNEMGNVAIQLESLHQKQMFGYKIIKAQEEERRRVAREIHDGPAQSMANVVFRAEVCERLIDTDLNRAKRELQDLREQVRICLQETRKIIFDLRPMMLDDLGLVATVRKVLDKMRSTTNMVTDLRVSGDEQRLESYLEVGLFRIIQEALNNVQKHSKADMVFVHIDFSSKYIVTIIDDNGRGFDIEDDLCQESFGLMGIRERVNLLNGELNIKSEIDKGTRIIVRIPLT